MYICNARGDPIASFHPANLAKFYHLEKGTQKLDEEILSGFKCTEKYLFNIWYKPDKSFKHKPTTGTPPPC
jgi:hypothetical protein